MIIPQSDPLTHIRALADRYQRGEISQADYAAAFQAASDDMQAHTTPVQCEFRRWGRRCKMPAIVWRDGKLYCAHHGKRGRG